VRYCRQNHPRSLIWQTAAPGSGLTSQCILLAFDDDGRLGRAQMWGHGLVALIQILKSSAALGQLNLSLDRFSLDAFDPQVARARQWWERVSRPRRDLKRSGYLDANGHSPIKGRLTVLPECRNGRGREHCGLSRLKTVRLSALWSDGFTPANLSRGEFPSAPGDSVGGAEGRAAVARRLH
jgi:hypothetical protein